MTLRNAFAGLATEPTLGAVQTALEALKTPLTENGALSVGNAGVKFHDGFSLGAVNPAVWDETWINQGNGVVTFGGDAVGSSYLRVTLDPYLAGSEYRLTTKQSFEFPLRFSYGLSMALRTLGQECSLELVGCDENGVVQENTAVAAVPIAGGSIVVSSNVGTINFTDPHPFKGGDRIVLIGNTSSLLNIGPVAVTVVTNKQITVPLVVGNGTYTANGYVVWADPFAYAKNGVGLMAETAPAAQMQFSARRNGAAARSTTTTVVTTAAQQINTSPYSDSFASAGDNEIVATMEEATCYSRTSESLGSVASTSRYTQGIPDEEFRYKLRLRYKQLPNFSRILGRVLSYTKTGTTTATLVLDRPHGLQSGNYVQVYGARDQTNFPNITTQSVVTVVDPTTITLPIGTASTAASAGGVVVLINGSVAHPGSLNCAIQSIQRTDNVLTVNLNTTAPTVLPGNSIWLAGLDGAGAAYDGRYKLLRQTGTVYELESVGTNFGAITCGGACINANDVRLHYVRALEYTRHLVEIAQARGGADTSRALSVYGLLSVNAHNVGVPLNPNTLVTDVASAALTTTTTTAAIQPSVTIGAVSQNYSVVVSAVSGTNPTFDVVVEESDDTGLNWWPVYQFPRITATGAYRSPIMPLTGNRVRYAQTIGGTSPSFTRVINRLQSQRPSPLLRQWFDRNLVLNTLNSTTPTWTTDGCVDYNLLISMGAATTPPVLVLEATEGGLVWDQIGANITPTANSQTRVQVLNIHARSMRLRVAGAGVGATLNYVLLRGMGR
jgi:hypothetical protein